MANKFSYLVLAVGLLLIPPRDLFSQSFEMEFSLPGKPAGFIAEPGTEVWLLFDFNRDGVPDRPFIEQGNIYSLTVKDGTSNTVWKIPLSGYPLNFAQSKVMGFFEMDGEQDTVEIVMAEKSGRRYGKPLILSINMEMVMVTSFTELTSPDVVLLNITDVDSDGRLESVVADTSEEVVEVWGFK